MPAGSTYTPIATTTLGSATSSVTFNSFSGYTDLILVVMARSERNEQPNRPSDIIKFTFNGDTGSNYSYTFLGSNNSSAISYRESSISNIPVGVIPGAQSNSGEYSTNIFQFQSYSNSTTFKTMLARSGNPTSVSGGNIYMGSAVGLWRSTSAITSMNVSPLVGPNFVAGSTFTLYGITAA